MNESDPPLLVIEDFSTAFNGLRLKLENINLQCLIDTKLKIQQLDVTYTAKKQIMDTIVSIYE